VLKGLREAALHGRNVLPAQRHPQHLQWRRRLTFSCDGSHYLPWDEFLSKGYDFWASGKALG